MKKSELPECPRCRNRPGVSGVHYHIWCGKIEAACSCMRVEVSSAETEENAIEAHDRLERVWVGAVEAMKGEAK